MLRNLTGFAVIALAALSIGARAQEIPPSCHSPLITGNLANSADSLKSEVTGSLLCVQGGSAAVRLEVRQTTVAATLSALFAAYQVSYRSFIQLDEERDGKYEGSLRYVISRVLEGYNYVIKQNNSNIEVIVFNKKGKQATFGPIVVQASKDRGIARVSRNC